MAILFLSFASACGGNIAISMEKRPVGSVGDHLIIEEGRLNSAIGVITVCGRDHSWQGGYEIVESGFSTTVGRRETTFSSAG